MKKNLFYLIFLLVIITSKVYSLCWTDGTCAGTPPPSARPNVTTRIRQILQHNWPYMRQKLFYGSWVDTLFELEWFAYQIQGQQQLNLTDNKLIWQFCRIDKLNVANKRTLGFNVTIDIPPKFYFETELPLHQYLDHSIKKFAYIKNKYKGTEEGVISIITCGDKLFELLEDVTDHLTYNKRLYPDQMLLKTQDIQDVCSVYLPGDAAEPWLITKSKTPKPHYFPDFYCIKCLSNVFDILNALWVFENCATLGTCSQYDEQIVEKMADDVLDLFVSCV